MQESIKRFTKNVDNHDPNSCWNWIGSMGYKQGRKTRGRFWLNGRNVFAHRASWELYRGLIPKGKLVLHKCDNDICVNPDHLYLGSYSDNMADRQKRHWYLIDGRPPKLHSGEKELIVKLRSHGISSALVGKMFKISLSSIYRIQKAVKLTISVEPNH